MAPLKTDSIEARRAAFRKLHGAGCFVIPNPWDVGSARYLQGLGFQALATTSAGFAFSRGLPDAEPAVPRDLALNHFAEMVAGSGLPVNADYRSGYADSPEGVFANVRLCAQTGVAGLSIEDATGDRMRPLYELPLAVDRIRAARAALDESAPDVLLTARAECFLTGRSEPLKESIERLQAYAAAGADVLYAPGPSKREEIKAIVAAAHPKPVNILMGSNYGLRVSDLAEMGVRRISVGSALARAAWTGFIHAAKAIAEEGSFKGLEGSISFAQLNGLFERDL
jgi:2-methylisocitrate lyase-like PEP mutase family enzyme